MIAVHATLAALLGLVAPSLAQGPRFPAAPIEKPAAPVDAERIAHLRRELAVDDPARRAWAAWEASEKLVRELAPDVLAALERASREAESEARGFLLRSLLDAVLRLDARPTKDELERLAKSTRMSTEMLLLAAKDPVRHATTIESMRRDLSKEARFAADGLLAIGAPDRAVALLIGEARVRIEVQVHDPDRRPMGGRTSSSRACGSLRVPEGFPPTVLHTLSLGPRRNLPLVADGPRPVHVDRAVYVQREIPISHHYRRKDFDIQEQALDMLRWIAGDRSNESPLAYEVRLQHAWTTHAAYLDTIAAEVRARREAWTKLVDALVARGVLAPEKRPAEAPIEVVVEDLRNDTTVPLPPLPQ